MIQDTAVIKEVIRATPTVVLVRFNLKSGQSLNYRPGQYVQIILKKEDKLLIKNYSIVSSPSQKNYIELCLKVVPNGYMSNLLANLKKGQELQMRGPLGIFFLKEPLENDAIFLATGTGISSIKPMINVIFEKGTEKQVWLFFGVNSEDEIVYRKEFEELVKKHHNFHFVPVLSDPDKPWKGETGYVQAVMTKLLKDFSGKDVYLCGVQAAVEEQKVLCDKLGFKNIYFEKYV